MRKLVVAAGAAVAAVAFLRRRSSTVEERVDLLYEDGSAISLALGTERGDRLLERARDVLQAARA